MPHILQHISRKAISAMNKPAFFDPNRLLYASREGVTKIINADNTISTLLNANVFTMKAPFSVTRGSYLYLTDYIVKKEAILCFKGNTIVLFNNEALRIYDKDMEAVRSAFPSSELTEAEGLTLVNNNITCVDFDADTINGQEIGELFQYGWDHEPGWTPEPQEVWGNPGYDGSGNRTFEIDFHTTATTQDLSAQRSDEADSYGCGAGSRGHYGVHIDSAYPGNHIITNTDTMVWGNIYLPGVPFYDDADYTPDYTQSSNFLPEGTYIRVCNGLNAGGGRIMTGCTEGCNPDFEELGGSDCYDCYDFIVTADEDTIGGYKYVVVAQSDAIGEDPDTMEPIYPEFPPVQS